MPKKKFKTPSHENNDLRIYEVKSELPPFEPNRPIDERLPQPPFVLTMICKVRSGKSNLLCNLLLQENMYRDAFDMIYIISPTIRMDRSSQNYFKEEFEDKIIVFDDMDRLEPFLKNIIEFQEGFDIKDPDNQPPKIALCFDDISGYLKRNSFISHIYSRYRHYGIMGIFTLNQTLKTLPAIVRSQSTDVILSNCYNVTEREKILEEWGDTFKNHLESAWEIACKERFNFCFLRLATDPPEIHQFGKDGLIKIDYENLQTSDAKNMLYNNIKDNNKLEEQDGL